MPHDQPTSPANHQPADILPGTLELMILRVLEPGSDHGYGVARAIKAASGDAILLEEGTLYPALRRLEKRGLLESEWRTSESNRRARYYSLTPDGHRKLDSETQRWRRASEAVERVLSSVVRGSGESTSELTP